MAAFSPYAVPACPPLFPSGFPGYAPPHRPSTTLMFALLKRPRQSTGEEGGGAGKSTLCIRGRVLWETRKSGTKYGLESCLTATFRLVPPPGRVLVDNFSLFLSCLSSAFSFWPAASSVLPVLPVLLSRNLQASPVYGPQKHRGTPYTHAHAHTNLWFCPSNKRDIGRS